MLEQKDLWIVLFVKIILRSSGVLSTLLPVGPLIKYLMKFCLLYHPSHQRSLLQLFLLQQTEIFAHFAQGPDAVKEKKPKGKGWLQLKVIEAGGRDGHSK